MQMFHISLGHKGPVLWPRCIGLEPKYYSSRTSLVSVFCTMMAQRESNNVAHDDDDDDKNICKLTKCIVLDSLSVIVYSTENKGNMKI